MDYNTISAAIMDENDDLVYVADPQTYELLYMNKRSALQFGKFTPGVRCYEFLQGKTEPCPFCTNHLLNKDTYYIWEFLNPISKRYYYLKDKLINLDGRELRLEICTDITDKENVSQQTRLKLAVEKTLVRCIETLSKGKDTTKAINKLLHIIGDFYQAERAYIFEYDFEGRFLNNTYEWCLEGIVPQIDNLYHLPFDTVDDWLVHFEKEDEFFITSVNQELDPQSLDCQLLEAQRIDSLMAAPLRDEQGQIVGFIGVDNPLENTKDISLLRSVTHFIFDDIEKRKLFAELEKMSYVDLLTGLSNRNSYIALLNKLENEPPEKMGVVYVDMNGLKIANDTYGHEYGDILLMRASNMMKQFFSQYLFRIGGDEFVAICTDMEQEAFEEKVMVLRAKSKADAECRFSIGACWTHGGMSPQAQIVYSDELMYVEKQAYYSAMTEGQESHRSRLSKDLVSAIANQEFVVYLQPKVCLKNGKLFGAEALVRRRNEDGSLLAPDRFIPLYEGEGIIRHVDFFVLENVCKLLQEWKAKGYPLLQISVNFSRVTLMEQNVVEKMAAILEKYGISGDQIQVEVTESISKMSARELSELSKKFAEKDFLLSLDDFGSQFSNLVILTQMDFNELKLDKSLIHDLMDNPKSRVIVEHAIHMCKELNHATVVAEGIESLQQLDMLDEYKCDVGQGYFFSRPIPINVFQERFLAEEGMNIFEWKSDKKTAE